MLCEIQAFQFQSVRHVPGKSNKLTDALSRLTKLVSRTNFTSLVNKKPTIFNVCKKTSTRTGHLMREDPLVLALAEAGSGFDLGPEPGLWRSDNIDPTHDLKRFVL